MKKRLIWKLLTRKISKMRTLMLYTSMWVLNHSLIIRKRTPIIWWFQCLQVRTWKLTSFYEFIFEMWEHILRFWIWVLKASNLNTKRLVEVYVADFWQLPGGVGIILLYAATMFIDLPTVNSYHLVIRKWLNSWFALSTSGSHLKWIQYSNLHILHVWQFLVLMIKSAFVYPSDRIIYSTRIAFLEFNNSKIIRHWLKYRIRWYYSYWIKY